MWNVMKKENVRMESESEIVLVHWEQLIHCMGKWNTKDWQEKCSILFSQKSTMCVNLDLRNGDRFL